MSEGPVLALLLARQGAVGILRDMLGPRDVHEAKATAPDSLRARFASPEPGPENGEDSHSSINLLHGSTTEAEVEKDIQFFFPIEHTVAAIKPDAYTNRDEIAEQIKSAGFHVAARRDTQLSEDLAEQLYSNLKDEPFYEDLVRHMTRQVYLL
ncbi:thioredoxin domain-containing protein 3 [Paragonimus westermani]|uniref:Thioredoxin domain-containing protein 3 n=1 Tax=Paragonimus westermani TaxID=34504 RepID=A0A5J4NBH5_9TREM|nr:thioredoxin domain-containing protein 3 [Paragonimus westermani]